MTLHKARTLLTYLHFHIVQKEKVAKKIARVNWPLQSREQKESSDILSDDILPQ